MVNEEEKPKTTSESTGSDDDTNRPNKGTGSAGIKLPENGGNGKDPYSLENPNEEEEEE